MKTNSPKRSVSIFGIICTAIGHNYKVTRKVTDHINEYQCSHCGKEVTDNLNGNLELLTFKTRELNTAVSSFCHRRMLRTTQSA
jgi:hypothetical protein